jgi:hypothetical protein
MRQAHATATQPATSRYHLLHVYIHTSIHTYIEHTLLPSRLQHAGITCCVYTCVSMHVYTHISMTEKNKGSTVRPHTYIHIYMHTYNSCIHAGNQALSKHTYKHTYIHTCVHAMNQSCSNNALLHPDSRLHDCALYMHTYSHHLDIWC